LHTEWHLIVTVGVDVLLQVVAVQAPRIAVVSVTAIASSGIDDRPTHAATAGFSGVPNGIAWGWR
jgi:hypothetical protein